MGNKQEVADGRPAPRGGPPWADAPEVAAPGAQVPAPEVVPEVRAGRHRRTRRKAGSGRHNSR